VGEIARRYVVGESLQFTIFEVVIPALVVLAAPWRRLTSPATIERETRATAGSNSFGHVLQRIADGRLRHRSPLRSVGFLALYCAVTVFWRVPGTVDALARVPGLSLVEALTLLVAGVLLWLELLASPPFVPRSAYPMRIAVAAIAMWATWILGYLIGLSHVAWFTAYHHGAGAALSLSADQQMAAGALWLVPAVVYLPVIFASLMIWLKDSEDPDDEMRLLLRNERRRSWLDPHSGSGREAPPGGPDNGDGHRGKPGPPA
jgi:cytochrome c oxidase assembly factor CtaG